MKPVKKTQQDRSAHVVHHKASNDAEEVVVPGVAALVGILLTGLLYLVLPPDVIIGPNWLLLVIEGVFVVPLFIDLLTAWELSHTARRVLVLVPLGIGTLAWEEVHDARRPPLAVEAVHEGFRERADNDRLTHLALP